MNAQKSDKETASLSKYKKIKYLGKGSYGAALLVCLRSTPAQKFVVKEIIVGHLKPAEQQAAKNEAEVLHQMSHSNITMYIESFVEGSKLYIVMEYADGGDLHAAIKRRVEAKTIFREDEAMRIFVQICLALKHVHGANILHRDLKSQNIFLTMNGIVKLGDFGIAKVLDTIEDNAKTQIGTPYYLSPEICENLPYGQKSDIWSLGVVLFELSALELPFQAASLPALVHRICTVDPPYNKIEKNYSSAMLTMLKSMLSRTVDARPSVKDLVRSTYIKGHICELLSFTLKAGTGGGEGALDTTMPKQQQLQAQESLGELTDDDNDDFSINNEGDDANRKAAKERQRAVEQARKEKLRKFKKERAAAAQNKKNVSDSNIPVSARSQFDEDDDDESVSTFMTKNESPRQPVKAAPVVIPGANKPVVTQPVPLQQYRQQTAVSEVERVKQQMYSDHQNAQRAQQQQQSQQPHPYNNYNANDSALTKHQQQQQQYQQPPPEFESAARKEYFANRAAAEQFKARAGYGGRPAPTANSPAPYMAEDDNNNAYNNNRQQQQSNRNGSRNDGSSSSNRSTAAAGGGGAGAGGIDPNDLKHMDPETRIAYLKSVKEKERVHELQEQERQLQLAREATREAQHQLKLNQQKRLEQEKQENAERELLMRQQAENEQYEYEQRQRQENEAKARQKSSSSSPLKQNPSVIPQQQTTPVRQNSNPSSIRSLQSPPLQSQPVYQEPVNIIIDGVQSRAAKNGLAFEIDLNEGAGSQKPKKHSQPNLSSHKSAAGDNAGNSNENNSNSSSSSSSSNNNNDRKTKGWGKPVTDLGIGNKKLVASASTAAVAAPASVINGGESTPGSNVSDPLSDSLDQQTPIRSQSTPELASAQTAAAAQYISPPPPFHTDLPTYDDDTEEENLYLQKIIENTEKQNQELLRAKEMFKQRREKRMNQLKMKYQQQYQNGGSGTNNQPVVPSGNERSDKGIVSDSSSSSGAVVTAAVTVGEMTPTSKTPSTKQAAVRSSSSGSTRVSSTVSAADVDLSTELPSPIDSRAVILPSIQKSNANSVPNSARKSGSAMSDMLGRVAEAVQAVQNAVNTTPTRATPHKNNDAESVSATAAGRETASKPSSARGSSRRKLSEEPPGGAGSHKPITKIVEKLSTDLALDEKINKQLNLELEMEDTLDQWFSKAKPASARVRHTHGGVGVAMASATGSSKHSARDQQSDQQQQQQQQGIVGVNGQPLLTKANSVADVHYTPLKRQHSSQHTGSAGGGDISYVSTAGSEDLATGHGDAHSDDAFIAGLQCALAAELMSDD